MCRARRARTHGARAHLEMAHVMLLLESMKPLYFLLILALGPALGELTSDARPLPVVVSVSDVHQIDNVRASADLPTTDTAPRT
jgi:hypothetical protein